MQVFNGVWKATDKYSSTLDFTRLDFDDSAWEDIIVPGHWQEHPAFAHYPEKMLFRRKFEAEKPADDARAVLRLEGVFYFSRVWLNGVYLGEHTGYFEPFEFDVTAALNSGPNVLAVFARCEREKDLNNKRQALGVFGNWDCIPANMQPGGIWGEVRLFERPRVFVKSLAVGEFQIDEDEAVFRAGVTLAGLSPGDTKDLRIDWTLSPHNIDGEIIEGQILLDTVTPEDPEVWFEVAVPSPRLWNTWDRGRPSLYRMEAALTGPDGGAIHRNDLRFGIRTVALDDWIFKLNGKSLFCRGSNYAPGDARIAAMDRDRYEQDVRLMRDANLNMVRVHAHVERPEFYELCDEYGILVWQDFPLQWYYAKEIEERAVEQIRAMVRMLAHHPCIAVWCCHNEPFRVLDMEQFSKISLKAIRDFAEFGRLFWFSNWNKNELDPRLRDTVLEEDDTRPVIPNSGVPGLLREGTDGHLYFGWYMSTMRGLSALARVNRRAIRFLTEYGAQAYPIAENFKKIMPAEKVSDIDWDLLQNEYLLQKNHMDKFVPPRAGASIEDYVGVSQWYQARLIQYHNELLRRYKYNPSGGAVHFLFNDAAPGVTWSVVDYWRGLKQGFYALRDSFRPLLPMAEFPKRWYPQAELISLRLFVVNDHTRAFPGATLAWTFTDDTGAELASGNIELDIAADAVDDHGRARWDSSKASPGGYALLLVLSGPDIEHDIVNQYEFELRK